MKDLKYIKRFNESENSSSKTIEETIQLDRYDVEDIFLDIEGLNVSFKEFSNLYLDVNFECESGINPKKYKEEFDRLFDYLNMCGFKFECIDTYNTYYLTWCWEWDGLFNIPNNYVNRYNQVVNKITISFENTNWKNKKNIFEY